MNPDGTMEAAGPVTTSAFKPTAEPDELAQRYEKLTAEPDAVERCKRCGRIFSGCVCGRLPNVLADPVYAAWVEWFQKRLNSRRLILGGHEINDPPTSPESFRAGHAAGRALKDYELSSAESKAYLAGRAEVLKPLREIYARGRVTFRSDGTLSSLDAQEREFEAALDESGDYINKPEFIKEKQNDKSNDPRPGPVPKRDDEYR